MLPQGALSCTHVHALEDDIAPTLVAVLLSASHVSVDILFVFLVRNQSLRKAEVCFKKGKARCGPVMWEPSLCPSDVTPFPKPLCRSTLLALIR